jgi:chromosome segregation ATPase
MELNAYIGYALAGVALLTLLRVLWSTSGRQLARYRELLEEGTRTQEQLQRDLHRIEQAREMLHRANLALQKAIKEKDSELASQANEIRALRKNLDNQRAANDLLNDTIGNQQLVISQLSNDVNMLKEQVVKLRAQMGLEP